MWNALCRRKWNTVAALRQVFMDGYGIRLDLYDWEALLALSNVGPRRVLALVNFLRDSGVELSWFAEFDGDSANWTVLAGCRRAAPVAEEPRVSLRAETRPGIPGKGTDDAG